MIKKSKIAVEVKRPFLISLAIKSIRWLLLVCLCKYNSKTNFRGRKEYYWQKYNCEEITRNRAQIFKELER